MGVSPPEKTAYSVAKNNLSKNYDLGSVRHPRRLIKIYRKLFYRTLGVNIRSDDKSPVDGPGTVYISDISEVKNLVTEGERGRDFRISGFILIF